MGPHHGSLTGLFWIVAAAQVAFGAVNAIGMQRAEKVREPLPAPAARQPA